MPVSNSTIPSPAATAHALPWGTPGQGRGRRRRYTPGRTRSPRPSSGLRFPSATAEETRLRVSAGVSTKETAMMAEEEKASSAATKVQEAAASVQQASAAKQRGRITGNKAEAVTRRYFETIGAHDVQG